MSALDVPNSVVLPDIEERLQSLLAPIQAELDQADAAEHSLEDALRKVRADKRRLKAVMTAATPKEETKEKQAVPARAGSFHRLRDEHIDRAVAVFKAEPEREFTAKEIRDATRLSPNLARQAVDYLRSQEVIRKSGTRKGARGPLDVYRYFKTGDEA